MRTVYSNKKNIQELVIRATRHRLVLLPGAKTPWLVTKEDLPNMKKVPSSSTSRSTRVAASRRPHATTHADRLLRRRHPALRVANMPGAVPNTSTLALTNATLRYGLAIAGKGWKQAVLETRRSPRRQRARWQDHLPARRRGPRLDYADLASLIS